MPEIYYVYSWETGEMLDWFFDLLKAKHYARSLGHDGKDHDILKGYAPIAYVADKFGRVIYNPRFSKPKQKEAGMK